MTVKTINVEVAVAQITLRPTEAKTIADAWKFGGDGPMYSKTYADLMCRLGDELRKAGF